MVWLHGGGFSGGTANTYDPRRLVLEGDVIVITVEFRVNIFGYFGYFGYSELKGSGVFGLQDQQAALRWIRRNIKAFGGDPNNVTLFGESGGAIATCAHLISPGSKGLFQKAILQSGAVTTSWPINTPSMKTTAPHGTFWRPLEEVEKGGANLAARLGCSERKGAAGVLECLRALPMSKLLSDSQEFGTAAYGGPTLPLYPPAALKEGRFSAVPVLSGYNRDECRGMASGMQLMAGGQPMSEEDYHTLLEDAFGDRRKEVEVRYPRSRYASAALAWSAIYTDRMFVFPQLEANRAMAQRALVFAYEFADPHAPGLIPFLPGFPSGASHSGELAFLFDLSDNLPLDITTGKRIPLTDSQKALAHTMIRYWAQFARTGNPNRNGVPHWPRFQPNDAKPQVQFLAPGPQGIGPRTDRAVAHQCEFWQKFLNGSN
jgi:para-nitrobenzyl esterase